MSKNDRIGMEAMDMGDKLDLPPAPLPAAIPIRAPESKPESKPEPEQGRELAGVYIPPAPVRDPLVSWSCKMPLRLRDLLGEVAEEYRTDMSKIVIDLLEIHLPKIPRRKEKAPRR